MRGEGREGWGQSGSGGWLGDSFVCRFNWPGHKGAAGGAGPVPCPQSSVPSRPGLPAAGKPRCSPRAPPEGHPGARRCAEPSRGVRDGRAAPPRGRDRGGDPCPKHGSARFGTTRLGTARPGDAEFGQATRARKMRGHRRTPGSGSPRSGHCLILNFQSGQSPIFIPGRNAIELGLTFRVIAQIGSWELKDACPAIF